MTTTDTVIYLIFLSVGLLTHPMLLQAYIGLTSCAAIALLASTHPRRRWGFVIGLLGQPAWFYSTLSEAQYGILAVTVFFTWVYGRGVWECFVRPPVIKMGRGG